MEDDNNEVRKTKLPQIKELKELNAELVRKFLFEYENRRHGNVKMKSFLGQDVMFYIKAELERADNSNRSIEIDADVKYILQQFLKMVDAPLNEANIDSLSQELSWPSTGSTITRITLFMQQAQRLEARLNNTDSAVIRSRLNKAIFRSIPKGFQLREDMADLPSFNTLAKIQARLITFAPLITTNEQHKDIYKLNRVASALEEVDNVEKLQTHSNEALLNKIQQQLNTLTLNQSKLGSLVEMHSLNRIDKMDRHSTHSNFYLDNHNMQGYTGVQRHFNSLPSYGVSNTESMFGINRILKPTDFNLPHNAVLYDLNKTGFVDDSVKLWSISTNNKKTLLQGCLDSGCHTTAGSLSLHGSLCTRLLPLKKPTYFLLPNGSIEEGARVGFMNVLVLNETTNVELFMSNILVFLINNPHWKELLIGRPTLHYYKLLPSQNLSNGVKKTNLLQNNNQRFVNN